MPLWKPYRKMIDGQTADITNASVSPFAGAITAAVFLQEFVNPGIPWVHLDIMAWNPVARPGRPEGGEAQGMRAAYAAIVERFGQ
jgi:leucyl aminopeptidase